MFDTLKVPQKDKWLAILFKMPILLTLNNLLTNLS